MRPAAPPVLFGREVRRIHCVGVGGMGVAPLAVYLGSDKTADVSGQVFAVRNNEIFLFNQPRPVRTIHRSDGWTPERLAAQLKGAFAGAFTPLERSEEVFDWDPI